MKPAGKKLGILISCDPDTGRFQHALGLAGAALESGVDTYVYCLDDAVRGVGSPGLQQLRQRGLKLFACALAARSRQLPADDNATYSGLTTLGDIIAHTDRFVSFGDAVQNPPQPEDRR